MKRSVVVLVPVLAALILANCAQTPPSPPSPPPPMLKDNELATPANYKSWPVFLANVQRPDVKQIRDIYINNAGAKATAGGAFANGTVSVMEIYKAQVGADGNAVKGADGNMVKGDLLKVFVMGKNAGWGASAPAELRNGDWIYSAYLADGKTVSQDAIGACRGCHLPLGTAKDFVHRYDEYFQKRKS